MNLGGKDSLLSIARNNETVDAADIEPVGTETIDVEPVTA
jgi:hypothetical protein